jgi:hypothetical protein
MPQDRVRTNVFFIHNNEYLGPINGVKCLEELGNYQFPNKDSIPQVCYVNLESIQHTLLAYQMNVNRMNPI